MSPLLFGLILAGGQSKRMGEDKAALRFHGKPQLQWAFELVAGVCEQTFVSVRPDQSGDAIRASLPQIMDLHPGIGPIAGIEAALARHPDTAWLVLACDLPFLSRTTLDYLIENRDPNRVATAFRSTHDGLPEPLCAIWEPKSAESIGHWIAIGKECPRKLLINSDVALLEQADSRSLDNVNTPQERTEAQFSFSSATGCGPTLSPALSPSRERELIDDEYSN